MILQKQIRIFAACLLLAVLAGLLVATNLARAGNLYNPIGMGRGSNLLDDASTATPTNSFQTSTPGADGSIIHIVQAGETLIGIAKAYGLTLDELLGLNNITRDTVIWPGEKLLIRPAQTPTPTSPSTPTSTPPPATPTRRPTRTPTPTASPVPITPTLDAPSSPTARSSILGSDNTGSYLVSGVIIFAAAGLVLIIFGAVLKRRT